MDDEYISRGSSFEFDESIVRLIESKIHIRKFIVYNYGRKREREITFLWKEHSRPFLWDP